MTGPAMTNILAPTPVTSPSTRYSIAGIDHHAVADQTQGVGVENARGNGAQLVHLAPLLDSVPRIVATLCADDDLCLLRENVDDLALAFVAPLDAHNNL